MKQLIIGIGTGRCGTLSLCTLLNRQRGVSVSHEYGDPLKWLGSSFDLFRCRIDCMDRHSKCKHFYGDISFYNLNYCRSLLTIIPSVKIIYLTRDREEVITSFKRKILDWKTPEGKHVDHWTYNLNGVYKTRFDESFPKYETGTLSERIGRYCDEYAAIAGELKRDFPLSVYEITMNDLNNTASINALFDFLGIPFESRDLTLIKEVNRAGV